MLDPQKVPPKGQSRTSFVQIPIIIPAILGEKKNTKYDTVESQYFDLQDQFETDKPGNTSALYESPKKESPSPKLDVSKNSLMDTLKKNVSPLVKFELSDSKQKTNDISRVCYGDVITLHMWDENNECYNLIVLDSLQTNVYFEKEAQDKQTDVRTLFRILPASTVRVQEEMKTMLKAASVGNKSSEIKDELKDKIGDLQNEYRENVEVYRSLIGTPIRYNKDIQIVHEATKKYLCINQNPIQITRKGLTEIAYEMEITTCSSASTQFQIFPALSYQMEGEKFVLTNHSFSFIAVDPENKTKNIVSFSHKSESAEGGDVKHVLFSSENKENFLHLKVINFYNEIGEECRISKPVRIDFANDEKTLRVEPRTDKATFDSGINDWCSLWKINLAPDSSMEDGSVYIKHFLTSKYLGIVQDRLVITEEKKAFQIETKKSKYMAQVLFKLKWKENNTYVNIVPDPENPEKQIGKLGNDSKENLIDIFKFKSITEEERLEASFCADCFEKLNLLLTLSESQLNTLLMEIIWMAAYTLRGYLLNELDGKTNLEYAVGSPLFYRQEVLMQMGILFTIIDIFRSWEKRKNILEFASGPDKLRLGDLMLEVLKVSAYNNRKNQIQIFFSLVHLFDPIVYYEKCDMVVMLAEKIRAGNVDVQTRQEELNVICEKVIDKLLTILQSKREGVFLKILRVIIKKGESFNRKFQDLVINRVYTNEGDINQKFLKNFTLEEGMIHFEDVKNDKTYLPFLREQFTLLSTLACGNNETGIKFAQRNFPIGELLMSIEKVGQPPMIRSGLIRVLTAVYIDSPGNKEYFARKVFRSDQIDQNFPPVVVTERRKDEIENIWTIICQNVNVENLQNGGTLVLDALDCAYLFLTHNLIWELDDKPIVKLMQIVFSLILGGYEISKNFNSNSEIRMQQIDIKADATINYSLPLSTNVTVALLNKWASKSQDKLYNEVKLQKIDLTICQILDFVSELRNDTLLINALQYMINTSEAILDQKMLLAKLVEGKDSIFPGGGFKKMFPGLIDSFEDLFSEFMKTEGRAQLAKKTDEEIKQIETISLFDHLVLMNNRLPEEDTEGRYMAFEVSMHILKEKTTFMKGLDLMILLQSNKEEARGAKLNRLLNHTLSNVLQEFSQCAACRHFHGNECADKIIATLEEIVKLLEESENSGAEALKLNQDLFSNLKGHHILLTFLRKNQELLIRAKNFENDKEGSFLPEKLNKIFDLVCKNLTYFCKRNKRNKEELWNYKEYLLFPRIAITERSYELDIIYELIKENKKIVISYSFGDFIEQLKIKANTLNSLKDAANTASAKCIANIFFEIMKYGKLFSEDKWTLEFYMNTFKGIDLLSVSDNDTLEMKMHLLRLITNFMSSKQYEFGGLNLIDPFQSFKLFDVLIGLNNNILKYSVRSEWKRYFTQAKDDLIKIYYCIFMSGNQEERKLKEPTRRELFHCLSNANYAIIAEMYQKNGMQEVWDSLKYDITDKLLTFEGSYSNTERVELGVCKKDVELKFNIIPDATAVETMKAEDDNKKEIQALDKIDSAKEPEPMKAKNLARMTTVSYLSNDSLHFWKKFSSIMISHENEEYVLEEMEHAAERFINHLDKFINDDTEQNTFAYMEYLKRLFDLLSKPTLYYVGLTKLTNMLYFLNIIIFIFKKYETLIKNMLLPSSHSEKVSEQFRNFGLLRMIFKLFSGLRGFKLEQAESTLLRLQRHLLYNQGEEGHKAFINYFSSNLENNAIFQKISKLLIFTVKSINEYGKYQGSKGTKLMTKRAYKIKSNILQNIFEFLRAVASSKYDPLQEYLRQQGVSADSQDMIKLTVNFLYETLAKLNAIGRLEPAIYALRAIYLFAQGSNEENIQVIIDNGFLSIVGTIFELDIGEQIIADHNQVSPLNPDTIELNFAKMKLKLFATLITLKLLSFKATQKEVFAKVRTAVSEDLIAQNLFDYYYLFNVEKDMKYTIEMQFLYTGNEAYGSSLIVEVGFALRFLLEILATNGEGYSKVYGWINVSEDNIAKESLRNIEDAVKFAYALTLTSKAAMSKQLYNDRKDEKTRVNAITKLSEDILSKYSGRVDINENGKIETAYFTRPPYAQFLDGEDIKKFEDTVDRASHKTKADGLMKSAPGLLNGMRINCAIANFVSYFPLIRYLYRNVNYLKPCCYILAIAVLCIILYLDYNLPGSVSDFSSSTDASIYVVGVILLAFTSALFFLIALRKIPFNFMKARIYSWDTFTPVYKTRKLYKVIIIWLKEIITDYYFLYYMSYMAVVVVALVANPLFFVYHLTLIFVRSDTIHSLLKAILGPIKQILMSFVIYFVGVLFFTLISYTWFPQYFQNSSCQTLLSCFLISVDQTFKANGGLPGFLITPYTTGDGIVYARLVFDFFFSFLLVLLFINMITGIIIDKFEEIRDESEAIAEDKEKECFICSKPRGILDSESATGFTDHITKTHYMWDYVFFVGYILDKPHHELSSTEEYVLQMVKKGDTSWIPNFIETEKEKEEE